MGKLYQNHVYLSTVKTEKAPRLIECGNHTVLAGGTSLLVLLPLEQAIVQHRKYRGGSNRQNDMVADVVMKISMRNQL